jgi:geranylgeranyl pyrophosphate synthase
MLQSWLPVYQEMVESFIADFFDIRYGGTHDIEQTYEEALRYAVEWGGKRLRPILALLAYEEIAEKNPQDILSSIIGIELMHCFTLVHDDLPCMDNDEYRRGKLTVWKKYGEAMAVLIGDSLQTMGFELLAKSGNIHVIAEMAHTMGDRGVARGQVRDTFLRHDTLSLEELLRIHDEKTGWFIASALVIGALLADASPEKISAFRTFGILLGRAFQVKDDILDHESDCATLGKAAGKDVALGKWIVSLVGIEKSRELLMQLEHDMLALINQFRDIRFRDIVEYVIHREK